MWYSMRRVVNAKEENPNRETIIKVWKDYTIEDAIVIEKAVRAIKPKTINSCWGKPSSCCIIIIEPVKEIIKVVTDMAPQKGGECG